MLGFVHEVYKRKISLRETAIAYSPSQKVHSSNIYLFFLSKAFLDTRYINSEEVQFILERYATGEAIAYGILLEECAWQKSPLGILRVLPPDGISITTTDLAKPSIWNVVGQLIQAEIYRKEGKTYFEKDGKLASEIAQENERLEENLRKLKEIITGGSQHIVRWDIMAQAAENYARKGDKRNSLKYWLDALKIARENADEERLLSSLCHTIQLLIDRGRLTEALEHAELCIILAKKHGNVEGEIYGLWGLATLDSVKGRYENALQTFVHTHCLCKQYNIRPSLISMSLANIQLCKKQLGEVAFYQTLSRLENELPKDILPSFDITVY